jgi:hypothetical protein
MLKRIANIGIDDDENSLLVSKNSSFKSLWRNKENKIIIIFSNLEYGIKCKMMNTIR